MSYDSFAALLSSMELYNCPNTPDRLPYVCGWVYFLPLNLTRLASYLFPISLLCVFPSLHSSRCILLSVLDIVCLSATGMTKSTMICLCIRLVVMLLSARYAVIE